MPSSIFQLVEHDLWQLRLGEINRQPETKHIIMRPLHGQIFRFQARVVRPNLSGQAKAQAMREFMPISGHLNDRLSTFLTPHESRQSGLNNSDDFK